MAELLEEKGPYGRALQLEIPTDTPEPHTAIDHWLITCPTVHPAWTQWYLAVISLADAPGLPPAELKFVGATHQLFLVALNPDHGPYTRDKAAQMMRNGDGLPMLQPVNLIEQYQATDAEMRQVCQLMCRAIVQGLASVEPPLGYESFRDQWLASITKTLAHLRGEQHAP